MAKKILFFIFLLFLGITLYFRNEILFFAESFRATQQNYDTSKSIKKIKQILSQEGPLSDSDKKFLFEILKGKIDDPFLNHHQAEIAEYFLKNKEKGVLSFLLPCLDGKGDCHFNYGDYTDMDAFIRQNHSEITSLLMDNYKFNQIKPLLEDLLLARKDILSRGILNRMKPEEQAQILRPIMEKILKDPVLFLTVDSDQVCYFLGQLGGDQNIRLVQQALLSPMKFVSLGCLNTIFDHHLTSLYPDVYKSLESYFCIGKYKMDQNKIMQECHVPLERFTLSPSGSPADSFMIYQIFSRLTRAVIEQEIPFEEIKSVFILGSQDPRPKVSENFKNYLKLNIPIQKNSH